MAASLHLARYSPREAGRMIRAMLRHHEAFRRTPGLAAARVCMVAKLDPTFGGTPLPTRFGLLCGWESSAARDEGTAEAGALAPFTRNAEECWELALDTVRVVQGDWHGWRPSPVEGSGFAPGEPIAVMTYGRVRPRYLPTFTWNNRKVARELAGNGDVGFMVGLSDTATARCTVSLWSSRKAMLRFAYGDGVHDPIQRRSLGPPWARDYFFARFRPVRSRGTWDGTDPLRELRAAVEPAPDTTNPAR